MVMSFCLSMHTENPSRYRFTTCSCEVYNRFVGPSFSTNLLQPQYPRNRFVLLRTCSYRGRSTIGPHQVHIWVDPMWIFTGSHTNLYRNELGINLCLTWYAARFSVHFMDENLKVGSMSTSSCIFFGLNVWQIDKKKSKSKTHNWLKTGFYQI